MNNFHSDRFPKFREKVEASWVPLLIEPIEGSLERLVFGVAAVSESSFHLEIANRLDRLKCLYSDNASVVEAAIRIAADNFTLDLAKRASEALHKPNLLISGIVVGAPRLGQGESLEAIAKSWLSSLSSLHSETEVFEEIALLEKVDVDRSSTKDRLPILIKDYLKDSKPELVRFFSEDIQLERQRRSSKTAADIKIDYSGRRIVANFGTLFAHSVTNSANKIKTRLWELKVNRDKEWEGASSRMHEMLIQIPSTDDPQFSERQISNVERARRNLEEQADQEDLRLRQMYSVDEIGNYMLRQEAA